MPAFRRVSLFSVILGTVLVLGGLHMMAPDHWVPLMVVSRKLNYSQRKTYLSAAALGGLHAITSESVAAVALLIGIFLVRSFLYYLKLASIALLVVVGIYFVLNGFIEESPDGSYQSSSVRTIIGISAFPDFALIPIMLASSPLPTLSVFTVLMAFISISAFSLVIIVYGAVKGFSKALEKIPPMYIDYIMGGVLFVTAAILATVLI